MEIGVYIIYQKQRVGERGRTFMQNVSECDSLSRDGDVLDLCLGLQQGHASQVILLYSQWRIG